jgi:hypothetical protein
MELWRTWIIKETTLLLDKYYTEYENLNQMDSRLIETEVAETTA